METKNMDAAAEKRMTSVESRVTDLEGKLIDVRLGMERIHGDLRLNTDKAEQIRAAVSRIQEDTSEMIAVYRATPRIKSNVRWWAWFGGVAWALIMAGATLVGVLRE
jgi:hypothetical protein